MPFIKMNRPVVGEAISKATFADVVIDNLDYLNGQIPTSVSNSSFESLGADSLPNGWKIDTGVTQVSAFPPPGTAPDPVANPFETIHGRYALKLTGGNTRARVVSADYFEVNGEVGNSPGDNGGRRLVVRWGEKCSTDVHRKIEIEFYNINKSSTGSPVVLHESSTAVTDFRLQTPKSVTIPKEARFAKLALVGPNTADTSDAVYFDNVSMYMAEQLVVEEPDESSHAASKKYVDERLPTGTIVSFVGLSAPNGWLFCDGAEVSRETYAALYSVIEDRFGSGNGTTTFNLPDLRGRAPIGAGKGANLSNRTLGQGGGAETHTLNLSQIPKHGHDHFYPTYYSIYVGKGDQETGREILQAWLPETLHTNEVGGGGPHNNMQPFRVVNFIIKT